MSHEISGSDKMKDKCQTIACLSEEEINQIAGGYSSLYLGWWIRGIPAFDLIKQQQAPVVDISQQTFGF